MGLKSDKIAPASASDNIRIAILRELEIFNGKLPGNGSLTPTARTLASQDLTVAGNVDTTIGVNTVMITCVDGVESINGIIRPAGVYTFQPNLNDTVNAITVNPNAGRIIIDEL